MVTSLLDERERHARLIQTIAGYAYTESAPGENLEGGQSPPTPFDTPLDRNGISSFELTLSLDSVKSVNSTSSLWTEILEYEYKNGGPDASVSDKNRTFAVLAYLFVGLGGVAPKTRKEPPRLSRAAQSLLAEVFSYTNEGLAKWWKVVGRMRNIPVEGFEVDPEFFSVTSEFKRIQSWMDEILPDKAVNPGLSQRYVRGGSSLISACLSSIRSKSHDMNYSNILIDGGGRIVQKQRARRRNDGYSPHGGALQSLFGIQALDFADRKRVPFQGPKGVEKNERYVLGDSNYGKTDALNHSEGIIQAICPLSSTYVNEDADPNRLIEETTAGWQKSPVEAEDDAPTLESILAEANSRILRSFTIADLKTPNRAVVIWDVERGSTRRMSHIYGGSYPTGTPRDMIETMELRPRKIVPWDGSCPRCNPDLPLTREEHQITKTAYEGDFCFGHRLLHTIGDKQRTRDSSLRQPRTGLRDGSDLEDPPFPDPQRKVVSVARIDGNSIGWILNPTRFAESEGGSVSDSIRRRSMRFNAHWWIALSKALKEVNDMSPDTVACWVSAGDDIMLAEYESSAHAADSGSALLDAIGRFTNYLDEGINRELGESPDGPLATHCTGIAFRGDRGSIAEMMDRASVRESAAKRAWKSENTDPDTGRAMISEEKAKRESFRVRRMLIEPVQDKEGAIPFIDSEALLDIADFQSLRVSEQDDLVRLREVCLRAEAVETGGRVMILISGRDGAAETEGLPEGEEIPMGGSATSYVFTD